MFVVERHNIFLNELALLLSNIWVISELRLGLCKEELLKGLRREGDLLLASRLFPLNWLLLLAISLITNFIGLNYELRLILSHLRTFLFFLHLILLYRHSITTAI